MPMSVKIQTTCGPQGEEVQAEADPFPGDATQPAEGIDPIVQEVAPVVPEEGTIEKEAPEVSVGEIKSEEVSADLQVSDELEKAHQWVGLWILLGIVADVSVDVPRAGITGTDGQLAGPAEAVADKRQRRGVGRGSHPVGKGSESRRSR